MKSNQKGYTLWGLIWLIIVAVGLIGWVINIVKMIAHLNEALTGIEVFRMIGIVVAPLGAVLGWVA